MAEQAPLLPTAGGVEVSTPELLETRLSTRMRLTRVGVAMVGLAGVVAAAGVVAFSTIHVPTATGDEGEATVALSSGGSSTSSTSSTSSSTSSSAADQVATIEIVPSNPHYSQEYAKKTTDSYPFLTEHRLVEPQRVTTFSVKLEVADADLTPSECTFKVSKGADGGVYGALTKDFEAHGAFAVAKDGDDWTADFAVTFPAPGSYPVEVACPLSAEVSANLKEDVMCYYIRRELRELSDKMRSDFLDAFMVLAEVPTNEGVTKYGKYYRSLEDFEIVHLRAAGARNLDHMHDGMGLVTQHAAMTSAFELSLQAVNPTVSIPYWDYTIDAYLVGRDGKGHGENFGDVFKESTLFTEDWFGVTDVSSHRVTEGRFANQEVPRDYEFEIRSPYGFLRAPWNINPSKYVTRYHKVCGAKINSQFFLVTNNYVNKSADHFSFPSCDSHFQMTQTETYDSWYEYSMNMGYSPHGPIHGWVGGVGGQCEGGTWDEMYASGKITHEELMVMKHNSFFLLKNMYRAEVIEMPKMCSADTPVKDCMWVCDKSVVDNDDTSEMAGLIKSSFNIDQSHTHYKEIVHKAVCETPYWPGDHFEAASPVEASFWPIHPTLDRLTQYKNLVRPFTSKDWPDYKAYQATGDYAPCTNSNTDCEGHNPYDVTVFHTVIKDATSGTFEQRHLTNMQAREAANPVNDDTLDSLDMPDLGNDINPPGSYAMPYVYNHFEWNHCEAAGIHFKAVS